MNAPEAGAPRWRPMQAGDIAAVSALAALIHPAYPERDVVFADRLALAPEGCWLAERDREPLGYLLAHPWRAGAVPALDTVLGALPPAPDTFYVHDLALLPAARGAGLASAIVARVLAAAAARYAQASLVAVSGTGTFWQRMGFAPDHRPALARTLAGYDAGARYMVRPLAPFSSPFSGTRAPAAGGA